MEAKVMEAWPTEGKLRYAYEPKWDGFRSVSWSGPEPRLDSRNQKPLLRYFPELTAALAQLPDRDGCRRGGGGRDRRRHRLRRPPAADPSGRLPDQDAFGSDAVPTCCVRPSGPSRRGSSHQAFRRTTGTAGGAGCRAWRLLESHSVDHRSSHRPRHGSTNSNRPGVTGSLPSNSTCRTSTASGR